MKTEIPFITHGLSNKDINLVCKANQRFNRYCDQVGLDVRVVEGYRELPKVKIPAFLEGEISDISEFGKRGTLDHYVLNSFLIECFLSNKHMDYFRGDNSYFLIGVDKKIVQPGEQLKWHVKSRGGENYGLSSKVSPKGLAYCVLTTYPLARIEDPKHKDTFLDYIIRHELGHVLIPDKDLPEDAADNPMKPLKSATPEYLAVKNIEYTTEQIDSINSRLA